MVWFVLSIYLCLEDVWDDLFDDRNGWKTEIVVVVLIPMVALFVWYYFTHLRKKERKELPNNQTSRESVVRDAVQNAIMTSMPLTDFAKKFGKMQVKTMANPTTNEVHSFCVFTNEQGTETKVEFGKSLGPLRPQEITERKEQLVVVQKLDEDYELIEKL